MRKQYIEPQTEIVDMNLNFDVLQGTRVIIHQGDLSQEPDEGDANQGMFDEDNDYYGNFAQSILWDR